MMAYHPSPASDAPVTSRRDRRKAAPAWHRVAWVGVVVLLLHAAILLGLRWEPSGHRAEDKRLVVTEALLIEPPPAAPPVQAQAAAPRPPAVKQPPARAPAKPAHRSRPPEVRPQPAPPPVERADKAAPPAPLAATEGSVNAPAMVDEGAPVSLANGQAAGGAFAGETSARQASGLGTIHPSARLNFEMQALRGVQPWKGVFGQLDWRQDGDRYEARLSLKVLFRTVRAQISTGRIVDGALAPERFSETRRQPEIAELRRSESKVVFSNGAPTENLKPGAQDRLSVVMQLGAMLAANASRHPPGSRIPVQVVGIKDAEDWTFEVLDDAPITVPAGQYRTRHLIRIPRRPDDYRMDIWLAPDLGYLPVQMRQTQQNGDVIDLLLRDVSPL